jgi:hypothetical protein
MSTEEWRDVVGYEGLYQVSNAGRVKRVKGGQGATIGRILNPATSKNGYQFVELYGCNGAKGSLVHRLVIGAFVGPCPDGFQVNHKNGDKRDNRIENLEYLTPGENIQHSRDTLGNRHGAKLTESDVLEIREFVRTGVSQREIARRFGVVQGVIGHIVAGRTWSRTR